MRKELRDWLRRLHDEVHVTTVLVTHDQEEAMEVADHIVVMHRRPHRAGRRRRASSTSTRPTEFVMGFIGPVNQLGDAFVRPHDIEVMLSAERHDDAGVVERIVRLGFEVRVDLELDSGERLTAQITRNELDELAIEQGAAVFVRPRKLQEFSTAT